MYALAQLAALLEPGLAKDDNKKSWLAGGAGIVGKARRAAAKTPTMGSQLESKPIEPQSNSTHCGVRSQFRVTCTENQTELDAKLRAGGILRGPTFTSPCCCCGKSSWRVSSWRCELKTSNNGEDLANKAH